MMHSLVLSVVFLPHLLSCFNVGIEKKSNSQSKVAEINADSQFSNLVQKLWTLDKNRAQIGTDIKVSLQGRVSWNFNTRDSASYPFFFNVNKDLFNRPSYKAFIALLDNYNENSGIREQVDNNEINEMYNFLYIVMKSPIMKEVHSYLKIRGKANPVYSQFKHQLYDLWFRPYYRSYRDKVVDSSGFEHVFVGEINRSKDIVSGFHNWIQFYLQEKSKKLDYMGYLKENRNSRYLIMTRFKWNQKYKAIGSSFIGTSPEFEFALYSLVYMMGYEEITFPLDGMKVKITCFGINKNKRIGTCYPDIV